MDFINGGIGKMDDYNFDGIDPTLDSCCQREVGFVAIFW